MRGAEADGEQSGVQLKVLRVIARLNVGGPARHTVLLNAGLRDRGIDTLLVHGNVASGEASLEHLAGAAELRTRRVPTLGRHVQFWDDARAFADVFRTIWRERPDVVHTHTSKAGVLGRVAASLYNLTRRRSQRCAIVHTYHGHVLEGYFGSVGNRFVRTAEKLLGQITDCTIAISESQRRDLVERFRVAAPDRTVVIPLGLELRPFIETPPDARTRCRARLGLADDQFAVGFVGRFVPIKNLSMLLTAAAEACERVPELVVLLAGDGPLRGDLEASLDRLKMRGRVRFLGWQDDLVSLYASLDVLALSSMNEGTPVAIIEAMAASVPVVATAVGGVPDLVEHDRTGLLVKPSPAALAAALVQVAGDPQGAARRARAARHVVVSRHLPDELVSRTAEAYERAVTRKRMNKRRPALHSSALP